MWKKFAGNALTLFRLYPHKGELPAMARAAVDPQVPLLPKLILLGALIYVICPVDLLPGFLMPFVGMVDDLAVMTGALAWFRRFVQPHHLRGRAAEFATETQPGT